MSASISISISIDRKAALLAGKVLAERETITITQEEMGDHWATMVQDLDMSTDPPRLLGTEYPDNTPAAVRAEYDRRAQQHTETLARQSAELDQFEREIEAMQRALVEPMVSRIYRVLMGSADQRLYYDGYSVGDGDLTMEGFDRPISSPSWPYITCPELEPRREALIGRREEIVRLNQESIKSANDEVFARELPRLQAEFAARQEAKAKAEEEAQAAITAVEAQRAAKRLETGYWERSTSNYNERRYGAPWCARVSWPNGPKAVYEWGESTGKWGRAGELRVECRPGDYIAWGQKHLRRPGNSDHYILRMRPDGSMEDMGTAAAAYKAWREDQKQEKAVSEVTADGTIAA